MYFENLTKITQYTGKLKLTTENLDLSDDNAQALNPAVDIDLKLDPGQTRFFRLDTVEVSKAYKFSYAMSQKCQDMIADPMEIAKAVKLKGQKKQVTIKAEAK